MKKTSIKRTSVLTLTRTNGEVIATSDEFKMLVEANKHDLRCVDLRDADLRAVSLSGADLSGQVMKVRFFLGEPNDFYRISNDYNPSF